MALFTQSEELSDMAAKLVADHYPEVVKYELSVAYMFKDEMPGKCGTCRKASDQDRTLHGFDFIITIARDFWDELGKKNDETCKIAILDHELAHIGVAYDEETGEPRFDKDSGHIKTKLIQHNVEEFESIIERYGAYAGDLRRFMRAFESHKDKATGEEQVS